MIPVKCFTCGNVIADRYRLYKTKLDSTKDKREKYASKNMFTKTTEGHLLDELEVFQICCRRHILTHVEIE
tara:strand:+ start:2013 stop:2225 length:213 start_codon:yes stop_codon:yes gene_type:complete